MNGTPNLDPEQIERLLLELARGEPDWVLVDRRVLNLLLGPLTDLIVKVPFDVRSSSSNRSQLNDAYVWDDDELC
jgi:hypothetical protein